MEQCPETPYRLLGQEEEESRLRAGTEENTKSITQSKTPTVSVSNVMNIIIIISQKST